MVLGEVVLGPRAGGPSTCRTEARSPLASEEAPDLPSPSCLLTQEGGGRDEGSFRSVSVPNLCTPSA